MGNKGTDNIDTYAMSRSSGTAKKRESMNHFFKCVIGYYIFTVLFFTENKLQFSEIKL